MYKSLYRRYRPQTFADVIGQSAAVSVITRAVEQNTVSHAYLFSGPRGCGKTTVARLFAKAVNCTHRRGAEPCGDCEICRAIADGSCLDVVEIDGASNNRVDEIRELKDHVSLASFGCAYKVYIIDEVHMLTLGAFNALLKTLEEPPEGVLFILATTEPYKVPVTIRSRCQHIPFHGMAPQQIVDRLKFVVSQESIEAQDEALWEIARNSDGGMRDGLSLLEQALSLGEVPLTQGAIDRLLGGGSSMKVRQWITLSRADTAQALPFLEKMFRGGTSPERFLNSLFSCIRNLWLLARWGEPALEGLALSQEELQWISSEGPLWEVAFLEDLMAKIASALPQVRRGLSLDVLSGLLLSWAAARASLPALQDPALRQDKEIDESVRAPVFHRATPKSKREAQKIDEPPKPLPNVLEPKAPEVSEAAESCKASEEPVALPQDGEPIDGRLAERLLSLLPQEPHILVSMALADIYRHDRTAIITFSEGERFSFEVLKSERALESVRRILSDWVPHMEALELRCGSEIRRFDSFLEFNSASAAVQTDPTPKKVVSQAATKPSEAVPPPQKDQKEEPQLEKQEGFHGSLLNLVSRLGEGELLYYRRSDPDEEQEGPEEF